MAANILSIPHYLQVASRDSSLLDLYVIGHLPVFCICGEAHSFCTH